MVDVQSRVLVPCAVHSGLLRSLMQQAATGGLEAVAYCLSKVNKSIWACGASDEEHSFRKQASLLGHGDAPCMLQRGLRSRFVNEACRPIYRVCQVSVFTLGGRNQLATRGG